MKLNIQLIIIGVFVLFTVVGFTLFSNSSAKAKNAVANIVVWGTFSDTILNTFAETVSTKTLKIEYVEKDPATFERDLLEALAAGNGPDLFVVSQEDALRYQKFVYQIPYQSYSRRAYENTFIEESQIFLTDQGIVALPFLIDPLVMYYNRALMASSFIIKPPEFWDELITLVPKITHKNNAGAITQSGVALGTFDNIAHPKEILSTFMLQAGNKIVARGGVNNQLQSIMLQSFSGISNPADSTIRYYTSFADTTKENYAWNASLPSSTQMFTSGDLALYFGYASELSGIRAQNPNLNFDVTLMPQTRNSGVKATYGKLEGIAISRGSHDINNAILAAAALTGKVAVTSVSQQVGLPPVRKDLLALVPTDASYTSVFYNSAIIAQGWTDPDSIGTNALFKRFVDSVNSHVVEPFAAAQRASVDMDALLKPYNVTP